MRGETEGSFAPCAPSASGGAPGEGVYAGVASVIGVRFTCGAGPPALAAPG